ncbi:MAG: hypothetical protein PHP37_02470 [Patescibacteria group bacterium]|nr:hypothetical protein [Patescibacteria group bacterium]
MKKIKKNKLIIPALALAVFIPLVTMAASNDSSSSLKKVFGRGEGRSEMLGVRPGECKNLENLTEEEKAVFQANMEAKRAKIEARRAEMGNMTAEERETFRQERLAERDAINSAIEAGDYDAWLALANDKNCPFLDEVTRENFVEFFQNHENQKFMMAGHMRNGDEGDFTSRGRKGMERNLNSQIINE